jgi:hypothetical protein
MATSKTPLESPGRNASPAAAADPNLPPGLALPNPKDDPYPGHVVPGASLPNNGIPAEVHNCWQGAAADNRYIPLSDLLAGSVAEAGTRPIPLSVPILVDDLQRKDLNLFFSVVGKRSTGIQIGAVFKFLDEKGIFSINPDNLDCIRVMKDGKYMYLIKYHEEKSLFQRIYDSGDKQVAIDFVEIPHDHEIAKAIGTHYVMFRIAENIAGQPSHITINGVMQEAPVNWLWESMQYEFTITDKKT